jgi:hypothetical protein
MEIGLDLGLEIVHYPALPRVATRNIGGLFPRAASRRSLQDVWSCLVVGERSQFDDPASFCRCLCRCPWRLQRLGGQNSDRPVLRTNEDSPSGHRQMSRRPAVDPYYPHQAATAPQGIPQASEGLAATSEAATGAASPPRPAEANTASPPAGQLAGQPKGDQIEIPGAARRSIPIGSEATVASPSSLAASPALAAGRRPHPTPRPPPGHRKLLSGSFRRSLPEATTLLAKGRPSTRRRP